ncbi:MAG: hypothetical protein FWD57_01475, partial [Polyangiaceae bacterium]|nr:hypothetical protein [Polyangiaceae bacterium]
RESHESIHPDFLATVWLGNDRLTQQHMAGVGMSSFDLSIPASRVAKSGGSPLIFQVGGNATGTLHYEARLRFGRKTVPTDILDRGFAVVKSMRRATSWYDNDDDSVPEMRGDIVSPKGGDLVLMELHVVASQPSSYVVIDDPVPAGFEIVDSGLATMGQSSYLRYQYQSDEDFNSALRGSSEYATYSFVDGKRVQTSTYSREFRDDRALFFVEKMAAGMHRYRYLARATSIGSFVMPPTRVESMYQPEVYGRTGAVVVRVVP